MPNWIGGLLGLACAAGAHAGVLEDIRARGEVRMGYRPDAEPISYQGVNGGPPLGFAVDLCLAVLRDLGQRNLIAPGTPIRYIPLTNAERFKAITERTVDMECADTTNNRERRDKVGVAFTVPHYYAGVRMLVPKQSHIQRIEDLRGKTVLITKGTTTNKLLEERDRSLQLNMKALECSAPSECFKDLAAGKAQVFMMDDIQLFALRAQAPKPGDWEVVGKLLSIEPLAIMLPKGDPVWKQHFDRVLKQMIQDRSFHAAYARWFESPVPPRQQNYNIPMNYLLKDSLKFPTDQIGD